MPGGILGEIPRDIPEYISGELLKEFHKNSR